MKSRIYFLFSICVLQLNLFAQNIGINATGALPHQSAMLDISAINKGLLVPRMTSAQRAAITTPAIGLLVFDTETTSFWFHNGTSWSQLSVGSNGWNLTGNSIINPATHFLGTTDEQSLRFKVNNSWAGELHPTSGNVYFGLGAGQQTTTGQGNTAVGDHSLFANTSGAFNTATGNYALSVNTTGFNNTAHGTYALTNNTAGHNNTAIGRNSLFGNTTGSFNTATGVNSLLSNITGNDNTATGENTLAANTSGFSNTATGRSALSNNTIGIFNNAFRSGALIFNTTGNFNSALGSGALSSNSSGNNNTAMGHSSLSYNTTGSNNSAYGYESLYSNITGADNTTTGAKSLFSNTVGYGNTANGTESLNKNIDGYYNTASGQLALYSNIAGSGNTAIGQGSLFDNTIGGNNTACGQYALIKNTTGNYNTAVGQNALKNNIAGYKNIAIGYGAGTAANGNGPNIFNTISIGNDDLLNGFQNQVIIGNSSTAFIGGKVAWSVLSDARIKNTVTEDVKGLEFILRLRPVTYHISNKAIVSITGNKETPDFPGKYDGEKIKYTGFIAQEVEQAAKSIGYDFSGYNAPKEKSGLYTLSYEQFVVPLVKAMQEQQAVIGHQKNAIEMLEKRISALEVKK